MAAGKQNENLVLALRESEQCAVVMTLGCAGRKGFGPGQHDGRRHITAAGEHEFECRPDQFAGIAFQQIGRDIQLHERAHVRNRIVFAQYGDMSRMRLLEQPRERRQIVDAR
ncbi:hypothetical protein R77569_04101 [Ralstonia mannitolilytica]|uniref:Uncharacterized protein n=1 Tax=Ralstonia mannitolilytica TaxID=105219 RepID=A0ABM9KYC2_9RALS|nr:hypothetical protein R77569_04101 [Ralstonia mannitolilytica]